MAKYKHCLSVPQCNALPLHVLRFPLARAPGTQNTYRDRSREDCTLSRVDSVGKREVAKSFCDLGARPEIIVCQAVATKCATGLFFDEYYAATARVLYPTGLVIRCPIWPLSVVEKVPNCASFVRLSVAEWDQWLVTMPVFRSFL